MEKETETNIFVELGKKLPLTEIEATNRHSLLINSNEDLVLYDLSLNLLSKNACSEEKFNFKGVLEVTFPFYGVNNVDDKDSTDSKTNIFLNFYGYPARVLVNSSNEKINLKDFMIQLNFYF